MEKSDQKKYKKMVFSFQTDPGKKIFIAGTFNGWQPNKTKLKGNGDGDYRVTLRLPAGRHEYKFIVDDSWCVDPQNPEAIANDCGSTNSVIVLDDPVDPT